MVNDYFNTFLTNDFDSLDREMGGSQWFQREQERDSQREMAEQNELEKGRVEEEKESPAATTNDPFRPTYDRKKSSESKKERLERIKKEYEHKPFISVGSWSFWDDLKKRRDKRRGVQQQVIDEAFRDGLSANSPNLTQEVEQNEPTIMPLQKFQSVKAFCKKAAWEDEEDPTKAGDWWKGEEEEKEPSFKEHSEEPEPIKPREVISTLSCYYHAGTKDSDLSVGTVGAESLEDWDLYLLFKNTAKQVSFDDGLEAMFKFGHIQHEGQIVAQDVEHAFSAGEVIKGFLRNVDESRGQFWLWSDQPDVLRLTYIPEKLVPPITHEKIEEPMPGEVPSAEELEKWLQAGGKKFCKRG